MERERQERQRRAPKGCNRRGASNVGSAFEHVGRAGVAQKVAASGAAEIGLFHELAHFSAEDIGVKPFAVAGEEEGFFVLA